MSVTTFAGLDVGSEAHVLAAVDARGDVAQCPLRCTEDAEGYARLDAALAALAAPESVLVVCEATGHYWQNVVAHLWAGGWRVALVNPLRAARYGRASPSAGSWCAPRPTPPTRCSWRASAARSSPPRSR